MFGRKDAPLVPRNGHTLIVGIVARISGCANQKEVSLEDQVDHAKEVVADLYQGPVEFRIIATKGKGERLDREELAEVEAMLRTREFDLLVMEDLGRLVRGPEASRILGIGVDHGTRSLSPNDCIDTNDPDWEQDALEACKEHVGHNAHTSKRLKQKLMNRFKKHGGATSRPIYGYVIPPGVKTYDEWVKDEAATPIIQEGARLLRTTLNCSAVADYFNRLHVPVRQHKRSRKNWSGKKVRQYYRCTVLKGLPGRGFRCTMKHHESGRRRSVKNPLGPVFRDCPHLAHLDAVAFDELNALLSAKNAAKGRKLVNGIDPLCHVSRKDTRCPGGIARCGYCGRPMVWGGNGTTDHLMCSGAREWRCWNSVSFDGPLAVQRLMQAITAELHRLEGFDDQWRQMIQAARQDLGGDRAGRLKKLQQDEATLAAEKANLQDAIAQCGPKPLLLEKITELENRERAFAGERRQIERAEKRELHLPQSAGELRQMLEEKLQALAMDSPEFTELTRRLVAEFHVYLVRLCDGGHLLPRARVRLALHGIAPDAGQVPGLGPLLTRELTLDLFVPPQRERIREQAVQLAAEGLQQREIAACLAEKPTQTAVAHALALDRKMGELGLSSPYGLILEPPEDYSKLRRHLNPQYRFEPLAEYQRPSI